MPRSNRSTFQSTCPKSHGLLVGMAADPYNCRRCLSDTQHNIPASHSYNHWRHIGAERSKIQEHSNQWPQSSINLSLRQAPHSACLQETETLPTYRQAWILNTTAFRQHRCWNSILWAAVCKSKRQTDMKSEHTTYCLSSSPVYRLPRGPPRPPPPRPRPGPPRPRPLPRPLPRPPIGAVDKETERFANRTLKKCTVFMAVLTTGL